MAKVELKKLVDHLGTPCRQALEEAASLTVAGGHREVMIEHLLLAMSEQQGSDIRMILRAGGLDPDMFCEDVRRAFSRLREGDGQSPVFSPLLIELLEDAWMVASIDLRQPFIRSGAVLIALLSDMGRFCRFEYARALENFSAEKCKSDFEKITSGSVEETIASAAMPAGTAAPVDAAPTTALAKYAHNFTQSAREGKIDPVFCRDDEIRQIIDILARRRKNNPICVGEAGVGKTAVVEGLALKIVHDDVPESLKNFEIYGLDLGALQAGAAVKGEFEKRLKAVLDEVRNSTKPCVLFIDEAHTLIGSGGQAGGSDAANLLKPALARGEIKTIAATTWSEYKKYFEKDPALTRRFQLVKLDEPTVDEAQIIIRGLVPAYEKAHGDIYISEAGVQAAVQLSSRYITGRQLPDKAIDVLDTACARVKAAATGVPLAIEKLTKQIQALEREKATLQRDIAAGLDDKKLHERLTLLDERLSQLQTQVETQEQEHIAQRTIVERLKALRENMANEEGEERRDALRQEMAVLRAQFEQNRKQNPLTSLEVGAVEIAQVIADWTGVPIQSMQQDDVNNLLHLASSIGQVIKGQTHALQLIEQQLQAARLDLARGSRPLGVFLLVGPSGVGKTETALTVARQLFGGEQFLTTVNMSEFQEKHSLARLIGSPPGYVGYGEGGILTEAIRKKPYSVVLLDEVEKAELDVLNLFYQAFDKGMLADGEGREIDCKNVVFFLCSNLGSEHIQHLAALNTTGQQKMGAQEITTQIKPVLEGHFKPAFLARMQPVIYLPLGEEVLAEIIDYKLALLTNNFAEKQGIDFTVSDQAKQHLQTLCHEGSSGARLVDQIIAHHILPAIARKILLARIEEREITRIVVGMDTDTGDFCFSENIALDEQPQSTDNKSKKRKSNQKKQELNPAQSEEAKTAQAAE